MQYNDYTYKYLKLVGIGSFHTAAMARAQKVECADSLRIKAVDQK